MCYGGESKVESCGGQVWMTLGFKSQLLAESPEGSNTGRVILTIE